MRTSLGEEASLDLGWFSALSQRVSGLRVSLPPQSKFIEGRLRAEAKTNAEAVAELFQKRAVIAVS
jgi:hypothetical protein